MQHNPSLPSFDLNPEQQQAAIPTNGVFLVCAGAGSGKTRVITARMLNLMEQGVLPSAIVALTFTNKAAQEMKERIIARRGMTQGVPTVGTFHSYCLRLLKIHSHLLGLPNFSILDDDDQEKLLRKLLNQYGLQKKITPRHLSSAISSIKNESVTGEIDFSSLTDQTLRELCLLYEREKKLAHCFDFDDLLLETLKLFRTNNIFKEQFQARVRHILIDEYQDTNHVQHALLKAIALRDQTFALDSLCVVGDEDQAIYSWRGATVSNIINFARDFPTTVRFTIQQNYRSAQSILDVANTLIDHNTQRTPKKLWSERTGKDRVRLLTSSSSYQESDIVATFTKLQQARSPQRSIAVLYRSHYQSRAIEEALIRHSLPYVIIGGIRFYERQEIKDLLAYLRLVANPFDRISFMRVINVPARGLGDKFQEQFFGLWDQHPQDHFKTVAELMYDQLSPSKQTALRSFIDCFASLQASDNAHELLNTIIARTTYFSYLATAFEAEESTNKKDNVKELLYAVRAVEDRNNGTMSVAQFLDEVALLQDALMQQDTSDQQCIRLMTLHAAKGLEFDTVILTGLEEGVLPSNHNLYDPMAIEEERRLLYVGITRARERLLITHARYRAQYGTMNDQLPSRFIKEIIKEQIHHHDCSSLGIMQIYHYLSEWLAQAVVKSQPITTKQTKKEKNFTENKQSLSSALYLKQRVRHEVFGIGTIERIETKSDGQMVYLTVAFKTSTKKVAAAFVKPIS